MNNREYNSELVDIQVKLRALTIKCFTEYIFEDIMISSEYENEILSLLETLENKSRKTLDNGIFKNYNYLIKSLIFIIKWRQRILNADEGSQQYNACIANIKQINFEAFNHIPKFKVELFKLYESVISVKEINEVIIILKSFIKISFPTIFYFHIYQPKIEKRYSGSEYSTEEKIDIIVLSLQFTIDNEPWANPQILKPEELYSIEGSLSLNKWPTNFDTLKLQPVSTSDNNWFTLSLPDIKKGNGTEYKVSGHIVFKYPQSTFDNAISIRLLALFTNGSGDITYPTIIGYDQLILKVLDPNSVYFPTGFKSIDKAVFDIVVNIDKQLPDIDKTEKENFIKLLSGIVNYQGYCLQRGIYKENRKVLEDEFRDNLIQHLTNNPLLGEEISKESHIAGGRVEINFRGIIAELKVENTISDREKLYEKYGKQPVAYASGNTKQLSILCILDLTEKKLPPAPPQNNIKLISPIVHGFESKQLDYPSKMAMILIDGNTKKPSDYSK